MKPGMGLILKRGSIQGVQSTLNGFIFLMFSFLFNGLMLHDTFIIHS